MYSACHVINRIVYPCFLTEIACYDVASTIYPSLLVGMYAIQMAKNAGAHVCVTASQNKMPDGMGLHSSTSRLNLSAFCVIEAAVRGCLKGV
jgi:hypothetical protein